MPDLLRPLFLHLREEEHEAVTDAVREPTPVFPGIAGRTIPAVLCLIAISAVCYGPLLTSWFVSDDYDILGRISRDGLSTIVKRAPEPFFRPVTDLSFALDYLVWRFDPLGYRITSLLMHAAASSALFLMLRRLLGFLGVPDAPGAAFMSACAFAAMASHSEAVSWIAGRTDLLATLLGLAATACFSGLLGRKSVLLLVLSLSLLSMSFLAKESTLALPSVWLAVFAGSAILSRRFPGRHALAAVAGAGVCLGAYLLLRKYMTGQYIGGYDASLHMSFMRPAMLLRALACGLRAFLPPIRPEFFSAVREHLPAAMLGGSAALAGLLFLVRRRVRSLSLPVVVVLGACFLLCMIPVVTLGVSFTDTQSERFLYLPGAFAAPALMVPLMALPSSRRISMAVASLVVAAEAAALLQVNQRWITASMISKEIAAELSGVDLRAVVILNVPDSFRGAYVFRNGIDRAATIFQGREWTCEPVIICRHDVLSLDDSFRCTVRPGVATLAMPPGTRIRELDEAGFDVRTEGDMLILAGGDSSALEGMTIVSFRGAGGAPMLEFLRIPSSPDPGSP